jgi:hypothetical protein
LATELVERLQPLQIRICSVAIRARGGLLDLPGAFVHLRQMRGQTRHLNGTADADEP